MNQPKDYREMATDCVDHAAHTDRHDEAMEWIGLGVINALLAIADGPTGKQQSIDTLDGFERLAKVERYLGFLDKNPRDPNPSLIERVDAIDMAATMATRRLDQLDALLKVDSFADPLDEDDHRDRMDRHGDIWQRVHEGCWMEPGLPPVSHGPAQCLQLAALPGPLAFAPDAEEAPQDAAGAILCPECGHDFDSHGWDEDYALTCCHECDDPDDCRLSPRRWAGAPHGWRDQHPRPIRGGAK